ncbi:MAG: hypothetical protein EXR64_00830 [Dehalococcoidia bacterium]|nr:hypothetical protein [Dehalococcoidia bacterium]
MHATFSPRAALLLAIAVLAAAAVALGAEAWRRGPQRALLTPPLNTTGLTLGFGGGGLLAGLGPPPALDAANASKLFGPKAIQTFAAPHLRWGVDQHLIVRGDVGVSRFDPLLQALSIDLIRPETLLALGPDGATVRTSGPGAPDARIEALGGPVLRALAPPSAVAGAVFLKGGSLVALTAADRHLVTLWDVATGARAGELTGFTSAAPVYSVQLSEDGRRAAWVARATVQFHDVATNALGATLRFEDFVAAAAFTADGSRFVTSAPGAGGSGTPPGVLQWWDPATGRETGRAVDPGGPARAIAITPDGGLVATANRGGVTLWARDGGAPLRTLAVPDAVDVTFSLDGRLLATSAENGAVTVWRAP